MMRRVHVAESACLRVCPCPWCVVMVWCLVRSAVVCERGDVCAEWCPVGRWHIYVVPLFLTISDFFPDFMSTFLNLRRIYVQADKVSWFILPLKGVL
jgi:hypothetical protein